MSEPTSDLEIRAKGDLEVKASLLNLSTQGEVESSREIFHIRQKELKQLIMARDKLEEEHPYVLSGISSKEFLEGGVKFDAEVFEIYGDERVSGDEKVQTWLSVVQFNISAYRDINRRITELVSQTNNFAPTVQRAIKSELESAILLGSLVRMEAVDVFFAEVKMATLQFVPSSRKEDFAARMDLISKRFLMANPHIRNNF